MAAEFAVHPFEALIDYRALCLPIFRKLLETTLKDWAGILKSTSDRSEQFEFHATIPPLDFRLFAQVAPQEVRFGMEPLKYRQMATDSERYEPSSSSSTGTPPDEFFARNSDVRLCPAKMSMSSNTRAMPFSAAKMRRGFGARA